MSQQPPDESAVDRSAQPEPDEPAPEHEGSLGGPGLEELRGVDDRAAFVDSIEAKLLNGERHHRRSDVSEKAGVTPEETRDLWRALGFANARDEDMIFTDADVVALRRINDMIAKGRLSAAAARGLARAAGRSTDRLAMWQMQVLGDLVSGDDRVGVDANAAREAALLAAELADVMEPLLVYAWRRNLSRAVSRLVADSDPSLPAGIQRTVGFADLVSYTQLVQRMTELELATLVDRFESQAGDIVSQHGGAVIKTVGDEILFTHQSIPIAARIALDLVDVVAQDPLMPPLRVGLANGRILARQGDVYGDTVNRAARLTAAAPPHGVFVDHDVAWGLDSGSPFRADEQDPIDLPGMGVLRPWLLHRADRSGTAQVDQTAKGRS